MKTYQTHPNAEVAAIADVDEKRLNAQKEELGVPAGYASGEEMIEKENLDIVSVCTPNKFHKPLTMAALKAGCHVLCEKPMAMSAAEGREMVAAAEEAGRRLMINFSYRFTEQSFALKKQVDKGILGDVYFARTMWHRRRGLPGFGGWFGQKALSGGGPLIDLGVHRIDLALWLMGYPTPVWVMGSAYNHLGTRIAREKGKVFDVEDLAAALIKFDNGATLIAEASWAANIAEKELMETRLYGTEAGLVQRNVNETYEFEAEIYLEKDDCRYDMKLHPPVPAAERPMHHFVNCIVNDTPHMATGEEGVIVMEILDSIYESAAKGEPVRIER